MSDVRARAEERRAKILARSNKKVSAVNEDDVTAEIKIEVESAKSPKERPLAARRQFVQAKTEETSESDIKVEQISSPLKADDDGDPEVESLDQAIKRSQSSNTVSSETVTTPKKEIVYSTKTVKEIEEEVARNTAKFDESTLKKNEVKEEEKVAKRVKPKVELKSNVQPASVLRFIRLLLIVLLGSVIGFQTVQTNKAVEVSLVARQPAALSSTPVVGRDLSEFSAEFGDESLETDYSSDFSTPAQPTRSWAGWAAFKLRSQVECTLSAVGLVWWASRSVSPLVTQKFKSAPQQKAKAENFFNTLLAMYQSGFEGIFEIAFSALGEVSLYLFSTLLAVVLFTALYSDTVVSPGNGSSSVNSAIEGIVSGEL